MIMRMPSPLLAGFHLGLLQAGYLLSLSRALSSAHTTYALVITAWLAGAAGGLWWTLSPRVAVVLGLLAYLAVQGVLGSGDFMALSPWYFAPAVALSGLWSGRFFAVVVGGPGRPGRVFAAETDGFLLGTIAAVVAYAWLGRHALWVLPVVTGALVLRGRAVRAES